MVAAQTKQYVSKYVQRFEVLRSHVDHCIIESRREAEIKGGGERDKGSEGRREIKGARGEIKGAREGEKEI